MTEEENRPFRVLCLDGGGMRGLYTASVLQGLADIFAERRSVPALDPGRAFDLIVGTSTGAILGCALAAGISLDNVIDLYKEHGKAIFPTQVKEGWRALLQIPLRRRHNRHGAKALNDVLTEIFGIRTLNDIRNERGIALAIPALNMANHAPFVFKTAHIKNNYLRDALVVDTLLAATAAPIFRSLAQVRVGNTEHVFTDGGLWANNPVLIGLVDALDMTETDDRIEIYSIGTCSIPHGEQITHDELDWGFLEWGLGKEAIVASLTSQEEAYQHIARKIIPHLARDCQLVRFPTTTVPATLIQHLSLDSTSQKSLGALQKHAASTVDHIWRKMNAEEPSAITIRDLYESMPAIDDVST